ncbi:glycosyltransferase family 4 protein [bacterium]|nr:glycosyltransferase family 4 protein [bacterium]
MSQALTSSPGIHVSVSYSRQNDYVQEFQALEVPKFEVDTFSTTFEGLTKSLQIPRLRRQFKAFLVNSDVDIIYCPMWHPWNSSMLRFIRKKKIPYVLTVHDAVRHLGDSGRIQRWVEGYEQRRADAFIALSQHAKSQLDSRGKQPPFGTTIIPHAPFYYMQPTRVGNHDQGALKLLFIGRIRPYKGLDTLLEAFDQVLQSSHSDVSLTIAGSGDLKPYESQLAKLHRIHLRNKWLSDTEFGELLHGHDALVLPYLEASQSGVIAAAQGAGKPVIAFAVGGISEQITHGVDGLLAVDRTPAGLAQELLLLANNQHLLAELQEGAKNRSSGESTWASSAESVVQLCRSILSSR